MGESRVFSKMGWFQQQLFREVDGSSLAVFRVLFGAIVLFESINYGVFLCLDCLYRSSDILFKYHHFEWVTLLPGRGLEWVMALMGLGAIGVMLGWYYRLSIIVVVICFSYLFLLDQALYLNHYYMTLLLGGILIFVPAHRCWSVDAVKSKNPRSPLIPNWSLLWMAVQLEIILIYAGLVKLNGDWLNLEPMRLWMQEASVNAPVFFQWLTQDVGIAVASYGVIALHLIGAPLLLFKKTRLPVFAIYAVFHATNAMVFNIGIFPFLTIAATLLLFDRDWPRQVLARLNKKGWLLRWRKQSERATVEPRPTLGSIRRAMIVFIAVWLVLQLSLPWRHTLLPGDVAWNEAGHRFSWRMKLRDKRGIATFRVVAEDGRYWRTSEQQFINSKQYKKMVCVPDLVWQYAQMLDEKYSAIAGQNVKVYADTLCSLNTRKPVPLVNKLIDLSSIPRDHPIQQWVYPLKERLPNPIF
jgi:hypothetical protein